MNHISRLAVIASLVASMTACSNDDPNPEPGNPDDPSGPVTPETPDYQPGETPDFHYNIEKWDGTVADDIAKDVTDPSDADMYHENNHWAQVVTVTYVGQTATVSGHVAPITFTADGAHVNLNLADVQAQVIVTGESADGSLRITGEHRHMLTLRSLSLTSSKGPAINDQDRKRVFVNLEGDSYLEDSPTYAPAASSLEDRKGCFFSEGHVILSGSGVLRVLGRQRHGFATDGYLMIRPGATLVVEDAAKNAIHVKGGNTTGYGIIMRGGYVYANTSAPAGKAMKSDLRIDIYGGTLNLNCSGDPATDPDDGTLSSSACIKTDGELTLRSGTINMTATGHGGKGINATGAVSVSGGTTTIACSGDKVEDAAAGDTSTSKGLKTDGNISILGGTLSVSAKGVGSVGVEAVGTATQSGGVVYSFGLADAWRMPRSTSISSGTFIAGGSTLTSPKSQMSAFSAEDLRAEADSKMILVTENADKVYATFVWPVDVNPAKFYFTSAELTDSLTYETLFIK